MSSTFTTSAIDQAILSKKGLKVLLLQRRKMRLWSILCDFAILIIVAPQWRFERKSRWLSRRINRASITRMLGYDGHCSLDQSRCDVWINGVAILDGPEVLHLHNGDYIRVAIPSHPDEPDIGCELLDDSDPPDNSTFTAGDHVETSTFSRASHWPP